MKESDLNKKWDIHNVIQQAINSARTEPSPETLRKFKLLEDNQKIFMEKLEDFGKKLEEIKIQITGLPEEIFEKADCRYASKVVEKAVYSLIGLLVAGFILALWELIKK